jgi:ATP-dependent HslUV protease, peptidase subunit HslV
MTTIAVARKNGYVAIAADTMTKWGPNKETAEYIANSEKIFKVGDTYVAITGNTTFKAILADYFSRSRVAARFDTPQNIFKTWQAMHAALKDDYFLVPGASSDDPIESTRVDVLLANKYGIFGVAAHRTVQEFSKYYAFGSGGEIAMGAMYAVYGDKNKSAVQLTRLGVEAAAEFNDSTGLPLTSYAVKLRARRSNT